MNPWFQLEMTRERERTARRVGEAKGQYRRANSSGRRSSHMGVSRQLGVFLMRVGARLASADLPPRLLAGAATRSSDTHDYQAHQHALR